MPTVPAAVSMVTPLDPSRPPATAALSHNLDATAAQDLGKAPRDRRVVRYARAGDPEALDACGMRLVLADALRPEALDGDAVGLGARGERGESGALVVRQRDDRLAGSRERQAFGLAERLHLRFPRCAEPRLAAARRVVQA